MAFKKPEKPTEPIGGQDHGPNCSCIYHRSRAQAEEREKRFTPKAPIPKVPMKKEKGKC